MPRFALAIALGFATALSLADTTRCTGQMPVQLLHMKKLSPTADSLPRIKNPTSAQAKINQHFQMLDVSARENTTGCRGLDEQGDRMFFHRAIRVTSRGPIFLSLAIDEGAGCGGVHPYSSSFTLTYDLATGDLVKWGKYLTKANATDVTFTPVTKATGLLPSVRSKTLEKLFVAGWQNRPSCGAEDVANPDAKSEEELTYFQLSAATDGSGLSVLPVNLVSAVSACAAPVILGKSGMDELGIPQNIQDAMLHRQ